MSSSHDELIAKYGRGGPAAEKTAEQAKAVGAGIAKTQEAIQPATNDLLAQAKEAGQMPGVTLEGSPSRGELGRFPVNATPGAPGKSLIADYQAERGEQPGGREADVVAKYGRGAEASKDQQAEKAKEPEKEPGA